MGRSTGIPFQTLLDFNPVKGLNEVENPIRLSDKELVTASNIDLDNKGIWKRRKGWKILTSTTTSHSLCSDGKWLYYLDNGSLKSPTFNSSYAVTGTVTLSTGWGDAPMDSVLINDQLFISNFNKIGYITGRAFNELETPVSSRPELYTLPAGRLLTYYNGRLFSANGGVVWYSNPLDYQHTELKQNFLAFPEAVTLLKATSKGIWVSADKLYFLRGGDGDELVAEVKDSRRALIGTGTQIDEADIDPREDGVIVIWATHDGICMGSDNGNFTNLSVDKLNLYTNTIEGASIVRYNQDGIQQYLVSIN